MPWSATTTTASRTRASPERGDVLNVFLADEQDDPLDPEPLRRLADSVMEAEGLPTDTEVSLVFVGERAMTDYNEKFMQRQGPTDVLAFPLEDLQPGYAPSVPPNGPPLNIGDVFICPAVVRANADADGVAFEDEMRLIVVHGILHLLGYDHGDDAEAAVMENRERELLGGTRP